VGLNENIYVFALPDEDFNSSSSNKYCAENPRSEPTDNFTLYLSVT
jgi:hypothetical protein